MQVLTFGKCKLRVDGADGNIEVGDALDTHDADGVAQIVGAADGASWSDVTAQALLVAAAFARALYASTVDLDIIPVHVYGSRGTLS